MHSNGICFRRARTCPGGRQVSKGLVDGSASSKVGCMCSGSDGWQHRGRIPSRSCEPPVIKGSQGPQQLARPRVGIKQIERFAVELKICTQCMIVTGRYGMRYSVVRFGTTSDKLRYPFPADP